MGLRDSRIRPPGSWRKWSALWGLRKAGPGASLLNGELFLTPLFRETSSELLSAPQLAASEDGMPSGQ